MSHIWWQGLAFAYLFPLQTVMRKARGKVGKEPWGTGKRGEKPHFMLSLATPGDLGQVRQEVGTFLARKVQDRRGRARFGWQMGPGPALEVVMTKTVASLQPAGEGRQVRAWTLVPNSLGSHPGCPGQGAPLSRPQGPHL